MAADDVAKGALRLIQWGKEAIPSADDLDQLGPMAARLRAVLNYAKEGAAGEGRFLVPQPWEDQNFVKAWDDGFDALANSNRFQFGKRDALYEAEGLLNKIKMNTPENQAYGDAVKSALIGEWGNDIIAPDTYRALTNPLAIAQRFDRNAAGAPFNFSTMAQDVARQRLIKGPEDIDSIRKLSESNSDFTQLVMSFVQDGMSFEEAMAAARALGLG